MSKFWRRQKPVKHLFICYQPDVDDDQQLAYYLYDLLTAEGYQVFIDQSILAETALSEEIDREIQMSDFLVVLLSQESVNSQIVQAKVERAYDYRKLQERPRTLAVRISYQGVLPNAIDRFLDPRQYVVWESTADNKRVGEEIFAAIQGRWLSLRPLLAGTWPTKTAIFEDDHVVGGGDSSLAKVQELMLEEVPAPSGIMHGKFYVERTADTNFKRQILKKGGTLTTIRAARQTGKTSLLAQGVNYARQNGIKVVYLDLQRLESASLQPYDRFLRYLAGFIVSEFELDMKQVEQAWRGEGGSQNKLSTVLTYVLKESEQSIMLAMDDVDLLLKTDFHDDFFGLVRSWHNSRAFDWDEPWRKLNLVLVISTEPHLLIDDPDQSPFNVGVTLNLKDFNESQVRDLNQRHGSPVEEGQMGQMMKLLNGHPYLIRQALYTLVTESLSWSQLTDIAAADQGPFRQHLRRYYLLLHDKHDLKRGLKQVIQQNRCPDEMTFYRLLRAGLITGSNKFCTCRCDLYRMYLEDKL